MEDFGILIASDHNLEWLLKWWHKNYIQHNSFPICFVDLGMSNAGKAWCKTNGYYQSFDKQISNHRIETISKINYKRWSKLDHGYGSRLLEYRKAWLKKPFILQQSPFKKTLWLDLDCEVIGDLSHLKSLSLNINDIGVARSPNAVQKSNCELDFLPSHMVHYNCGVLLYHKKSSSLQIWQEEILNNTVDYLGDEDAFCNLVAKDLIPIKEISRLYNWQLIDGSNSEAKIVHWATHWGKTQILKRL